MTKALQCPDCSERHPLEEVAHLRTFRCRQCKRLLKVPAGVDGRAKAATRSSTEPAKAPAKKPAPRTTAAKVPPSKRGSAKVSTAAAATAASAAARVPPSQRGDAIAMQTRKMEAVAVEREAVSEQSLLTGARAPRIARVFAWMVALPLGLLPVLLIGRAVGVISVDRAVDVFVGVGWGRFVPPLLVLPLWAAASATMAHFMIEAVTRVRSR